MLSDFFPAILTGIKRLSPTIHEFEFKRPNDERLPAYTAGAHIDVRLPNGLVRQFSLIEPYASGSTYRIAVKRGDPGRGGSRYLHDAARVGSTFEIGAPRNSFPLEERATNVVLVAGGIGITPLWCMAQRLAVIGQPWTLWYAVQTRSEAALADELERHNSNVLLHVDDEQEGKRLDLERIVADLPNGAHIYCCGPAPMLAAFQTATARLPASHVHIEHFAPPATDPNAENSVLVKLARSGKNLLVPAEQSILDAVLSAGIDVPYSCQSGVCGACEVKVLEGRPDHRDQFLSEKEREAGAMMLCCSRACSPTLTLDL
ncbi:PDR/VanB family oxidoreductase [Paraburkholderia sp. MM5482-R1]|uniref:PDR/VanB family oxidoreductase n=1 Tax=unclassified Paraburkholderia TaxID=2615204 RepID=UPI003D1F5688